MKALLPLLAITTYSSLHAQEQPRFVLPNWDSINQTILGTDYVPFDITTHSGQKLNNKIVKGKVAFFSFWAKSCKPCIQEFGELNELYANFSNDTNMVFVAITYDKKEHIADVLEKYKVKFPVASVSSVKAMHGMNYGRGMPSAVLIDKYGKVRRVGYTSIGSTNSNITLTVDSTTRLFNRYLEEQ